MMESRLSWQATCAALLCCTPCTCHCWIWLRVCLKKARLMARRALAPQFHNNCMALAAQLKKMRER